MKYLLRFAVLIALMFSSSCLHEESVIPHIPNGDVSLRIAMKLPADLRNTASQTKSLTGNDEKTVGSIDLLAFVKGTDNIYRYLYAAPVIVESASGGTVTVKASLKQQSAEQIFVFLVNAAGELAASGVAFHEDLDTALPKLIAASQSEWNANSSSDFRALPMYTRTNPVTIGDGTTDLGSYDLVRMLARIDISVKATVTNFRLVNAFVFNRKTCGFIPYDIDSWDAANKVATRAWVPASHPGIANAPTVKLPTVTYDADPVTHAVAGSIYTFEAAGTTDRQQATAIVVGGYYDYPANSSKVTYYRIDIAPTESGYYSGDILRNHLYNLIIDACSDEGATTPEEAFAGEVKIPVTVTPWNLAASSVIMDGQHFLSLSRDKHYFDSEGWTVGLDAVTDHPAGLQIGAVAYTGAGGWLGVSGGAEGAPTRTLSLTATKNTTGATRTAEFTITAGNMVYTFKVNQGNTRWIEFDLDDVYLMDGDDHMFTALSDYDWEAAIRTGSNTANTMTSLITTSGGRQISGEPVYFSTLDDRTAKVKDIEIPVVTFTHTANEFAPVDTPVILVSGDPVSRSNCYILPLAASRGILIPVDRANESPVLGTQITSGDRLRSELVWNDKPLGMNDNSNIRLFGALRTQGTGYMFVRQGKNNADGNALVAVKVQGVKKWSWHIWVTDYDPGSAAFGSGNTDAKKAVTGGNVYKHYNGTDNNIFMDRNLGATSNTPGDPNTIGFLYQWGRKDPMPGAADFTQSGVKRTLYDINGVSISLSVVTTKDDRDNYLSASVQNPYTYFSGNGVPNFEWYAYNRENRDNTLWNSTKTIYDPCPEGWLVPYSSANHSSPWRPAVTFMNFADYQGVWNYGMSFEDPAYLMGYYPATGFLSFSGGLSNAGTYCYGWGSTQINDGTDYSLSWTVNQTFVSTESYTNHGVSYSVRCVKEKEPVYN